MMKTIPFLAKTDQALMGSMVSFFSNGGPFIWLLLICSLVVIAATVYKWLTLQSSRIIPKEMERALAKEGLASCLSSAQRKRSTLARLICTVVAHQDSSIVEAEKAVEAEAKEEMIQLNAGISVLEVIITIAPLLGLLGTATGLVSVFSNLGENADPATIAKGIAMALNTTIAGLAVAVPAVIAHSYFSRRIETVAARLESILGMVLRSQR